MTSPASNFPGPVVRASTAETLFSLQSVKSVQSVVRVSFCFPFGWGIKRRRNGSGVL
jgi:hypothetical protein